MPRRDTDSPVNIAHNPKEIIASLANQDTSQFNWDDRPSAAKHVDSEANRHPRLLETTSPTNTYSTTSSGD
jgi:hypothetical protein